MIYVRWDVIKNMENKSMKEKKKNVQRLAWLCINSAIKPPNL